MCKVCKCVCDNCVACHADKSHNNGKGGCGCATPGHVDYMDCGCTEGGTENAWPED
jgi:hypothetical protein